MARSRHFEQLVIKQRKTISKIYKKADDPIRTKSYCFIQNVLNTALLKIPFTFNAPSHQSTVTRMT